MDDERIRIVVIDNQISRNTVYQLSGKEITCCHVANGICETAGENYTGPSHGSVCAALAAEFFPHDDIIGISVADEQTNLSVSNVCKALSWCVTQSVQIVCMSIGTTNWLASLSMKDITKKLAEQGTKIFAAVNPAGILTFPACYPWITAVKCELEYATIARNSNQLKVFDISVGYFSSDVLDTFSLEDRFFLNRTSSMAVPFVASQMTHRNIKRNTWNKNNSIIDSIKVDKKRWKKNQLRFRL